MDLPSYRLSVADNGRGIPAQMLQSLVATSRGETLSYCFLGSSLAHLRVVHDEIHRNITTRTFLQVGI